MIPGGNFGMNNPENDYLKIKQGGQRFVFDIDGVIARQAKDNNYALAEPNREMIDIINKLYDMGNHIVLFTARGYVTGIDWSSVTKEQLSKWGLKYHELHFGKPNADYYVDDRMLPVDFLYKYFGEHADQ
jgi:CMP-N,N'-diacetyllegionaminic acid synthase